MDVFFRDVASSITTSVIGTPARRRGIGRLETGSWWLYIPRFAFTGSSLYESLKISFSVDWIDAPLKPLLLLNKVYCVTGWTLKISCAVC